MPPLIAGSTIGELSRNSLIADEMQRAQFADALDRTERARAMANQLALAREMADRQDRQFQADLGLRRDLGFAPWERGLTPSEAARNQFATQELAERGRIADAELRYKDMLAKLPYQRMTVNQAAELERQRQMMPAQIELLEGQAQYYKNGGKTDSAVAKERMQQEDEAKRLTAISGSMASNANQLLAGELAGVRGAIADGLTSFAGWGDGFTGANAATVADQVMRGGGRVMLGSDDVSGNSLVRKAGDQRTKLVSDAVARVLERMGADAPNMVRFDPMRNQFVPAFGSTGVSGSDAAPAPSAAPTIRVERGPDGALRVVGRPATQSNNLAVAPAAPQAAVASPAPEVDALSAARAAFMNANAASEGAVRQRFLEEIARRQGLEPLRAWDRIGSSTMRREYDLSPSQRVERNQAYYDSWFNQLPANQQIEILNAAMGR